MAEGRLPIFCPSKLLLALRRRDWSNAHYLHWAYAYYYWRSRSRKRWAMAAAAFVIWLPLLLTCQAWQLARLGPRVKAMTGKRLSKQFVEQLEVALRWSINPMEYYTFELFDDERRSRAGAYLLRHQFKGGLHNVLECDVDPRNSTRDIINNKASFGLYCQERGIAAVQPLLVAHLDGRLTWFENTDGGLPKQDLFLKPVGSKGGRGCERWRFDGRGYRSASGAFKTENELFDHLFELTYVRQFKSYFKRQSYLVQPCVVNHPDVAELSTGALVTARIMSCLDETGVPHVGFAVMKIVTGRNAVVDNFHAGGWVAAVDIASGRLGPATDSGLKQPGTWIDRHPVTGAHITGRLLPDWHRVMTLVEEAHRHFPDRVGIGWDVAMTPTGPCIVEANLQWGLDMVQRTHRQPVGDSRFAQTYAHHVRAALAALDAGTAKKLVARGAGIAAPGKAVPTGRPMDFWAGSRPMTVFWMAWGLAVLLLGGAIATAAWLLSISESSSLLPLTLALATCAILVIGAFFGSVRLALLATAALKRVLAQNLAIVIAMELKELRASIKARADSLGADHSASAATAAPVQAIEIPKFFGKREEIRKLLGRPTERTLQDILAGLQSYNASVQELRSDLQAPDHEAGRHTVSSLQWKSRELADQIRQAISALAPFHRAAA